MEGSKARVYIFSRHNSPNSRALPTETGELSGSDSRAGPFWPEPVLRQSKVGIKRAVSALLYFNLMKKLVQQRTDHLIFHWGGGGGGGVIEQFFRCSIFFRAEPVQDIFRRSRHCSIFFV